MTAVFVPGTATRFVRSDVPEAAEIAAPTRAGAPVPEAAVPSSAAKPVLEAPAPSPAGGPVPEGAVAREGRRRRAPDESAAAVRPAPRPRRAAAFRATEDAPVEPPVPEQEDTDTVAVEGYVLFQVGGTTFAVPVGDVREIVRASRLELLPSATAAYGHGVALVDARGRSVPVVDLRTDREATGDVLLPMWRHQVGLVVDRVAAVQTPRELTPEHDDVPAALPSYARGVLRPADGGAPVLLIALPDAADLELDALRPEGSRLGDDVLAADSA